MKENTKNNKPDKQEKNRDEKGRFKPGVSGNPAGRPEGISIREWIKQYLKENPKEFEELCQFYLTNEKMRDLLWKMLDGLPKGSFADGDEGFPPINIVVKNGKDK